MKRRLPPHESSCEGKRRLGEKRARQVARVLSDHEPRLLHAYVCGYCGTYHVGQCNPPEHDKDLAGIERRNPSRLSQEEMYEWAREARGLPPADEETAPGPDVDSE